VTREQRGAGPERRAAKVRGRRAAAGVGVALKSGGGGGGGVGRRRRQAARGSERKRRGGEIKRLWNPARISNTGIHKTNVPLEAI
jgi:hypothetical protein